MDQKTKKELLQQIVVERKKVISRNVKISLSAGSRFLSRDELLKKVGQETDIGQKIMDIQAQYIH